MTYLAPHAKEVEADMVAAVSESESERRYPESERRYPESAAKAAQKRQRASQETRRGKWSGPEEAFAARLIRNFENGLLQLDNGSTLRAFLSKKLNCSAMRISKKFAGDKCLGKQIYAKRDVDPATFEAEEALLARLEADFLTSIRGTGTSHQSHHHHHHHHQEHHASSVGGTALSSARPLAQKLASHRGSSQGSAYSSRRQATTYAAARAGNSTTTAAHHHHHHATIKRSRAAQPETRQISDSAIAETLSAVSLMHSSSTEASEEGSEVSDGEENFVTAYGSYETGRPLAFRKLGSSTRIGICSFLGAGHVEHEALELADAHQRANLHSTKTLDDLPHADLIQSPPAALMLELAPTPRPRQAHPTLGTYASSIARGTSSSSLNRMTTAPQTPVNEVSSDNSSTSADDDDGDYMVALAGFGEDDEEAAPFF